MSPWPRVLASVSALLLCGACSQSAVRQAVVSYRVDLESSDAIDHSAVRTALSSLAHVSSVRVDASGETVWLDSADRGRVPRAQVESALEPLGLRVRAFEEPHAQFAMIKVGGGG